jgi:hypothetical protein
VFVFYVSKIGRLRKWPRKKIKILISNLFVYLF